MHKRILIIEAADAVRGIAENVLRQNGYEVISVSDAEKALEVLQQYIKEFLKCLLLYLPVLMMSQWD